MVLINKDSRPRERHRSLEGRGVMVGKEFINRLTNDKSDMIQILLNELNG